MRIHIGIPVEYAKELYKRLNEQGVKNDYSENGNTAIFEVYDFQIFVEVYAQMFFEKGIERGKSL